MPQRELFVVEDVHLEVPTAVIGGKLKRLLSEGRYEDREATLLRTYLRPDDRVLELGGGAGLMAVLASKICGPRSVTVVEGHPQMVSVIRRNLRLNKCQGAKVIHGAVVADGEEGRSVDFPVYPEFWQSGQPVPGKRRKFFETVSVPARPLPALLSRIRPTALVMDVEGNEATLLSQPLPDVRLLIIEWHPHLYGEEKDVALRLNLMTQGFRRVNSGAMVSAYLRDLV